MATIKFKSLSTREECFAREVRVDIARHFSKCTSMHANGEMITKCAFWLILWLSSWCAILAFKDRFLTAFCFGVFHLFTHVMVAFNITHDANHGAMFKTKKLNTLFGYLIELLGCNRNLWILSHNHEHHTFINIHEHDNNIAGYGLLRLCPKDKLLRHHKYQWIYAPMVYGTATIYYSTFRDIRLAVRYTKKKLLKPDLSFVLEFLIFKIIYLFYLFIIPVFVFGVSLKLFIAYFIVGHFLSGLFLTLIFLIGHLTQKTSYPVSDENIIQTHWMVHVLHTTGDYATKGNFVQWLVGGINLHVPHHLFPKVCHVHYRQISKIIKKTANRHGYEYRESETIWSALQSHFLLLKALGVSETK